VARLIDGFTVIVTKSTGPVGAGKEIEAVIRRTRPDADVAVVSNPEFPREGSAIEDFKTPSLPSLPSGFTVEGPPLRIQLIVPHLGEAMLIRAGVAFQRVTTAHHTAHPTL
jgi:hypothetical protein